MPECALCSHYENEHTPTQLDISRRCRVRYYDELTADDAPVARHYTTCECPGFEPDPEGDPDA